MKTIVAIGGGSIINKSTVAIDREIIRLSGKKKPKLLFIGTAMSDAEKYWYHIQRYFGDSLGCTTDVLFLLKEKLTRSDIAQKILSADIIYVGGGNTLMMMKVWRRLGLDRLLKQAYEKGIVLSGISAGSICWFDSGHSDSLSFTNPKRWHYINVRGLGLIKVIHCPHYNSKTLNIPRKKDFQTMMMKTRKIGIAIDDNCALEVVDDTYRIIASKSYANAYRVYKKEGKIVQEKIEKCEEFRPMRELYENV